MRNRAFFNRPYRFAGYTVQDIEKSILSRLCDYIHHLSIVFDGEQFWSGFKIVVPEIVMRSLKMPKIFSRARIECENAVRKQVRPVTVRAVEIISGRAQWKISDTALFIH